MLFSHRGLMRGLLLAGMVALLATGCATRRYVGPTTGRSADMQKAISLALDNVVDGLSFERYAGKRCHLEVVSLAESFGRESPENEVLRAAFAHRLARGGVTVTQDPAGADMRLSVRARVVGVNVIRRDFPLLYYRETVSAVVDFHATAYSLPDGKILEQRDDRRRLHLANSYWFYIIGPFESLAYD